MPEPIKIYQEGGDHYGSLSDPEWRFEESAVPEELRKIVFNMRRDEFEAWLNVEIHRKPKVESPGYVRFTGDKIRVLDIDPDNRVRIGWDWTTREGGGSSVYCATALATFDDERVQRILERWRALKVDHDHVEDCESVLGNEGLSCEQVRGQIQALLKKHGLDQASIERKRKQALREAKLCDGSDASLARHGDLIASYPNHL